MGSRESCEGEIGELRVEGAVWLCGRDWGIERVAWERWRSGEYRALFGRDSGVGRKERCLVEIGERGSLEHCVGEIRSGEYRAV